MKTPNMIVAALFLSILVASGCATLKTSEQEEEILQEQSKVEAEKAPQVPGSWISNGWENEAMKH